MYVQSVHSCELLYLLQLVVVSSEFSSLTSKRKLFAYSAPFKAAGAWVFHSGLQYNRMFRKRSAQVIALGDLSRDLASEND